MPDPNPEHEAPEDQKVPQQMSKPSATPKVPTLAEFPHTEWEELCQRFEGTPDVVRVEIRRQTPKGTWSAVRTITIPPRKIPDLSTPLMALAGGGTFVFEVQDARTKGRLMQRWSDILEAPVKSPTEGVTIFYDDQNDTLALGPQHIDTIAGYSMPQAPMHAPFAPSPQMHVPVFGGAAAQHQVALPPFPQPQFSPQGALQPPPDSVVPGSWVRGYAPQAQWDISKRAYAEKHGAHPDEAAALGVSMQWVTQQNREVADARVRSERMEERLSAREAQMQAAIDASREQARLLTAELERERGKQAANALQTQIAGLEMKLSALASAPQRSSGLADYVPLIAALAPIATAMFTASADRSARESASQAELLKAMLAGQQTKSQLPEIIASVAPLIAPMAVQWLSNQSPEKLAEMRMSNDESRMALLKMMHDLIQSSTPRDEPEPWWKPVLMSVLGEIGGMGRAAMLANAQSRALPGGPGGGAAMVQHQHHQQPQERAVERAARAEEVIVTPPPGRFDALFQHLAQTDLEAAQKTALLIQTLEQGVAAGAPQADPRFLTHEWIVILFNMHAKLSPDELVPLVCTHLEHSRMFNMLPAILQEVRQKPHESIRALLGQLPTLDPAYAATIAEAIADEIEADEEEYQRAMSESESEEETEEEEELEAAQA